MSERQKRSFIIIIEEKFIGVFYFGDSLKEFSKMITEGETNFDKVTITVNGHCLLLIS